MRNKLVIGNYLLHRNLINNNKLLLAVLNTQRLVLIHVIYKAKILTWTGKIKYSKLRQKILFQNPLLN